MKNLGIIGIILVLIFTSCAPTNVPTIADLGRNYKLERDEAHLWEVALKEEMKLNKSDLIYHDPLLEEYLTSICMKLSPKSLKEADIGFRVKVLKDPAINAFAYPNGAIYIHTGTLARLENEAQLAGILGHEMTHVIHRDALRMVRNIKNKYLLFTLLGIGAAIMGAPIGAAASRASTVSRTKEILSRVGDLMIRTGLQLGYLISINGYSRELEANADRGGLELMTKAGYDPKEMVNALKMILNTYGDSTAIENFFFGNHPTLRWRINQIRRLIPLVKKKYPRSCYIKAEEKYLRKTRILIRKDAKMNIEIGRYNLAKHELEKVLKVQPKDAKAHYYMGKLLKSLPNYPANIDEVEREFKLAIKYNPNLALAHRDLGLLYYEKGKKDLAKKELQTYLKLAPDAKDKDQIEDYILDLE